MFWHIMQSNKHGHYEWQFSVDLVIANILNWLFCIVRTQMIGYSINICISEILQIFYSGGLTPFNIDIYMEILIIPDEFCE